MPINFGGRVGNQFKGLFAPSQQDDNREVLSQGKTTPLDYDTPMMDLYKQSLESMPDENNYKHGVMQKILAGVAGFTSGDANSAYKTTKGILDEPYENDLGRWKNKIGVTGELANLEEKGNAAKSKNTYDWIKYNDEHDDKLSLADYRKAQTRNLDSEIAHRGEDTFNDTLTGTRNRVSPDGKIIWSTRNGQNPKEKNDSELSLYNGKEEVRFATEKGLIGARGNENRRTSDHEQLFKIDHPLQKNEPITNVDTGETSIVNLNDPQATLDQHNLGKTKETPLEKLERAQNLASFKNELTQDNIKLRDELKNLTPQEQNAAYDGAVKKALIDNPEYTQFFDGNGNIDLKLAQKYPDVYNAFKSQISGEISNRIGKDKGIGDRGRVTPRVPSGNPLAPRGSQAPITDPDAESIKQLETQPDGTYQGSDGSTWVVKNRKATKIQGTK